MAFFSWMRPHPSHRARRAQRPPAVPRYRPRFEALEDRLCLSGVSFGPAVNWAAGDEPSSVAVGDFNGDGRNFCDRVGVNSVRSLDVNGDGFTDSPPLMVDDPFLLRPAIRDEVMVPLIKLYTVAFWKRFLEGNRRYMGYLTPGYAQRNDLEAFVTIE